ncbi:MAG TPA: YggT family protein [Casimicrobiaceae bacterium]|nr:YggT family protein [Casimicrobiaceae bacterium]
MLDQALRFLLDTIFGIITYAFLLRFLMQWMRAPFRNPLGQAVVALTDWAAKPVRRIVPGFRGLDMSTLVLAWLAQFLWLAALAVVIGPGLGSGSIVAMFALLACVELVKAMLWVLIIIVIAQAILSWTAPDGPFAGVLNALTFRFLAPIRRVIPPLGGTLDLSPLIVIILAQLALMLPVRWLEGAVVTLFR